MTKNLSGIKQPKPVAVIDSFTGETRNYPSLRECARREHIRPTTLYKAIKNKTSIKNKYYRYGENKATIN